MKRTNLRIFNLYNLYPVLIFIFPAIQTYSQSSPLQKVDYEIYAKLDTSLREIDAQATVLYLNNSPDTLTEVWFHLWANAYSSKNTSLARELIEAHNPSMYFLKQKELGGYTDISFRMGEQELTPYYTDDERQIARLKLNRPLPPGAIAGINIRYTLKIPKNILGYGYNDGQYILANWYPKVAAYRDGKWEVQVLNSQNLFSSDVGKYHLTLFVPNNYWVVSSGNYLSIHLPESEEWEHLAEKKGYKKLSFAHPGTKDFAWIANKQLPVFPQLVTLDNGKKFLVEITTDHHVLFEKNLDQFMPFLKDLIEYTEVKMPGNLPGSFRIFCSEKISHPVAFAGLVTTDLYAKSNSRDDNYVAREKLSSDLILMSLMNRLEENPVEKPWMYLGLGTFYFTRFMEDNYPETKHQSRTFKDMDYRKNWYEPECAICFKPANLSLPSYHCKDDVENYLVNPVSVHFNYLEKVNGVQTFDRIMAGYFSQRPSGEDFQKNLLEYFSRQTGQDYQWLFKGMMGSFFPFKYEIQKIHKNAGKISVDVLNTGNFNPPYLIGLKKGKRVVDSLQVEGHPGLKTFVFDATTSNKVKLDPFFWAPETPWLKQSAYIKKPNLRTLHYGLPFSAREIPGVAIDPFGGYNVNDGLMLGGIFSTLSDKLMANFGPLYSFRSESIVGFMEIFKSLMISDNRLLNSTIWAQSFHRMQTNDKFLRYYVINPSLLYVYEDDEKCRTRSGLEIDFSFIGDQNFGLEGITDYHRYITKVIFHKQKRNLINPYEYKIGLEHQYYNLYEKRQYLMFNAALKTRYMYKKNRYIHSRLYGATYVFNSHSNSTNTMPGTLSLIGYNMNDYAYDLLTFVDRSAQDGFWSRQISMHTGGFKTAISNAFGVGQSNRFVASVNLKMDLPFGTFIKPFFDFGVYGYLPTVSEGYSTKILYSAGLVFEILKDKFEIYLPLINSKEIEDKYRETYEKPFWGKFSFSLLDFKFLL